MGLVLIPLLLIYMALGKLRVKGWRTLILALVRGKVIIAPNHPAVLESLFLAILCCPFFPLFAPIFWPYSLPDPRTFLPQKWWGAFRWFRCITVSRVDLQHVARGMAQAAARLLQGASVVIHPEAGRTFTKKPEEEYIYGPMGRRIRPLKRGVVELFADPDVRVLPVWVQYEGDFIDTKHTFWHLLARGMTIHIGELWHPPQTTNSPQKKAVAIELGTRILAAGLEEKN